MSEMITSSDILHGKILIVDDQKANVALLEQMLRSAGYVSVASTMNPGKVCELHLVNRYDLILLDLQMPGMDGFQVMENLKEIETGGYLPVLVITAQPEHKLRALKAGARDFVSKPFDLAEVLIRVHNMLEVRLLHLETKKLYDRVVAEQKVSERLLADVLPRSIAERLKGRPAATAEGFTELITESFAEVTVLFADILEFTKFSEGASADVLRGVLDDHRLALGQDRRRSWHRESQDHRRCLPGNHGTERPRGGSHDPCVAPGAGPGRGRGAFQPARPLQAEGAHRHHSRVRTTGPGLFTRPWRPCACRRSCRSS